MEKISKKIPKIAANALNQLTQQLTESEIIQIEVLLKKMLLANGYGLNDFEHNEMEQ